MRVYEVWAPPGRIWGTWTRIAELTTMKRHDYEVEFETLSSAPSSFDAEIKYWIGNEQKTDFMVGPGTHKFGFGICYCAAEVRLRSHTAGQIVRVTVKGI
ncbi:MAG: colicin Z C-terminal domain-related protein [Nitrospinota bacterium]